MYKGFRWVLESNIQGRKEYLTKVEYTGQKWIFEFSEDISKALRYPIRKRADDDCDFFNRRGTSHYKASMSKALEDGRTFRVIDLGESA